MINRTFNKYKYFRTYIGGSKENEINLFFIAQDTKNDFKNSNWLEYRKLLINYFDDYLNVIFSWKNLFQNLSYILIFFSIFTIIIHSLILSLSFVGVSIIFQFIYMIFRKHEKITLKQYEICLDIVLNKIKEINGFEMEVN